jgi:putative ABC transport system substrate-binding protein
MLRKVVLTLSFLLALCLSNLPLIAEGQPAKIYRVGVVLPGGPFYQVVEGLRGGLTESGLAEGTHYVLHIRDEKGDLNAAEEAGRNLEQEKVDLIFAVTTSVCLAVKRVTENVPIVFYSGADPVDTGLVRSFASPGGRLTGINSLVVDLVPKRLGILRELSPTLGRVMTFYDPTNPVSRESAASARAAARQLGIELVEREIRSVEELRTGLRTLKTDETDAIFLVGDALVISQAQSIVEAAKAKKLLTMLTDRSLVVGGGLASYGPSYYTVGRRAAKYVHQILLGVSPGDLPVERFDRFELVLNARTAREINFTIPQSLLLRADEVIQ